MLDEIKTKLTMHKEELIKKLNEKKYKEFLLKVTEICEPYRRKSVDYDICQIATPYNDDVAKSLDIPYINASKFNRFYLSSEPKKEYYEFYKNFLIKANIKLIVCLIQKASYFDESELIERKKINDIIYDELYNIKGVIIRRIHCYIWEDHNVLSNKDMLFLYQYIKNIDYFNENMKTLIHCKGGVGRTGTTIMYSLLKEKKEKITKDIFFDTFILGRSARPYFVENPRQLKFLADEFLELN